MWFEGKVKFMRAKLPEAGILEVELEAVRGQVENARPFNSMAKGEKFTRKLGDTQRVLVRVLGILNLDWAHVVGETFTGNGMMADNTYKVVLQFAVGTGDHNLLMRLAQREGLDGWVQLEQRQLELELGAAVGAAVLRKLHQQLAELGATVTVGNA